MLEGEPQNYLSWKKRRAGRTSLQFTGSATGTSLSPSPECLKANLKIISAGKRDVRVARLYNSPVVPRGRLFRRRLNADGEPQNYRSRKERRAGRTSLQSGVLASGLSYFCNMVDKSLLFGGKYRIPSARLQHYDYASAGMYFVTINAFEQRCIFGTIANQSITLSALGTIINSCWEEIPDHFAHVELDVFQVMPNHMHGILLFTRDGDGIGSKAPGTHAGSVGAAINAFKGAVTFKARHQKLADKIWQPRFHEHVIRNFEELQRIREYIITNPAQWEADRYYRP
jgi:putative transposase